MNCLDCRDQLSAYYDGQLPDPLQVSMEQHVRQCANCSDQLMEFRGLSDMVHQQAAPRPPAEMWDQINRELRQQPPVPVARRPAQRRHVLARWVAIAASMVLAVGIGGVAYRLWHDASMGGHQVVDLSSYLNMFESNPDKALRVLIAKYDGRAVKLTTAQRKLGYSSEIADHLPAHYSVKKSYVLKMPCCKCVHCTCHGSDGRTLAILEHDNQHPVTFGKRPTIQTNCCGTPCRIAQVGDRLVASWRHDGRYITVIGARDLNEVQQLVRDFQGKP